MTRRSTERMSVALVLCFLGVITAVLVGQPAAVMLVTPWFVVLTLGVVASRRQEPTLQTTVDNNRVMVGDNVELTAKISGAVGVVKVTSDPIWRFGKPESEDRPAGSSDATRVGQALEVPISITANQWGMFDVGQVRIEITEPYGLLRWSGRAMDPAPIRVHPTPRQVKTMVGPRFVRRTSGTHNSRSADRGVEYADLRQFGPGDTLRDINWRVSARSPELWVSQRHPERATDVVLLLDSFVESGHDAPTVVGLAVEAAVAIAESHLGVTDRVGLVELGGLVRWVVPGTGKLQLQRLVDALLSTGLYASSANRDLALISPRALPPRSFVMALTPLLDQRFIDALYELAARGHDLAVVECDPAARPESRVRSDDGERGGANAASANELSSEKLAWRLWQAERAVMRDDLTQRNIAVARWDAEHPIDVPLQELVRRRARVSRMSRR